MKKLGKIIVIGICTMVMLTGCGNSMFTKAMEQGKLAVASKEYDKAEASFELALQEKEDDQVQDMLEQVRNMNKGLKVMGNSDVDEAIRYFNNVIKAEGNFESMKKEAKEAINKLEERRKLPEDQEKVKKSEIVQLSDEEHKKINIFFSNFSEAYFSGYDENNKDLGNLLNFAYIHNKINNPKRIEIEDSEMFVDKGYIEKTINQFFGVEITHQSIGEFQYREGKYYTPAADGENYNRFSQVDILQDNKDGTYFVEVSIYSTDEIDNILYEPKKSWENTYSYEYLGIAKATIKAVTFDGKEMYQLLSYEAIEENKNQEEVATKQENTKEQKKIYSLNEVCAIAKKEMQLLGAYGLEEEEDIIINGEVAYCIEIEFMAGDMPHLDQIYIGAETLNVYNYDESLRIPLR